MVSRQLLPAPVTEEKIKEVLDKVCAENGFELIKKNMGAIIKSIKSELPAADGKMVSQIVMSNLH